MPKKTTVRPTFQPSPSDTITDKYVLRFLSKLVETPDTGCLIYCAGCSPNGYGQFWDGEKSISAHRYSYQTFVDDLPADGVLMHSCNTPACCNWLHLRPGTHKENSQAASRDGLLVASRRAYRKATPDEIADIRARAKKGETLYSIAKVYDRSVPYIANVVTGRLHDPNKAPKPQKIIKLKPKPKPAVAAAAVQEAA